MRSGANNLARIFELGDTVVHYRSRVKSGLVVHYMGRFFARKDGNRDGAQTYGVLYLVDLGDRVQPVTATMVPGHTQYSMLNMDESAALKALNPPLWAMLQSIAPGLRQGAASGRRLLCPVGSSGGLGAIEKRGWRILHEHGYRRVGWDGHDIGPAARSGSGRTARMTTRSPTIPRIRSSAIPRARTSTPGAIA